jgi:hypothetical protein
MRPKGVRIGLVGTENLEWLLVYCFEEHMRRLVNKGWKKKSFDQKPRYSSHWGRRRMVADRTEQDGREPDLFNYRSLKRLSEGLREPDVSKPKAWANADGKGGVGR